MKRGGCCCGAVRWEASGDFKPVTYCHCSKCRGWHGHAGAYSATARDALRLIEQRGLKWHAVSGTVKRGFCSECGSLLFFDDVTDALIGIVAGSIDAPTGLGSKAHIYVASKGDWYELAHDGLLKLDAGPP